MRAARCIIGCRHRHIAFFPLPVKRLEQRHTENNRMPLSKRELEIIQIRIHMLNITHLAARSRFVTRRTRLLQNQIRLIRPLFFAATTDRFQAIHGQPDHRATVLAFLAVGLSCIVVDKETAIIDVLIRLAAKDVFNSPDDSIGCTAVHLPLILDGRHIRPEIDFFGELRRRITRRSVHRNIRPRHCATASSHIQNFAISTNDPLLFSLLCHTKLRKNKVMATIPQNRTKHKTQRTLSLPSPDSILSSGKGCYRQHFDYTPHDSQNDSDFIPFALAQGYDSAVF